MLTKVIILACGLAMRGPATPAGASSVRPVHDGVESCATDSLRAATVRRARHAARDGAWNDAAELWRDALLLDERNGAEWLALGDVLLNAERQREAAAAYQRAIQLDARLTERGTRGVARAYARLGDDRQAVRWLEQALRLGVRPAELWSEESFRRYRDVPRLQSELRRQVSRGGTDRVGQAPSTT